MRWVFWLLVVCNVVLFGGRLLAGRDEPSVQPESAAQEEGAPGPGAAPGLTLFGELTGDERAALLGSATGLPDARPRCEFVGPFANEVTAEQMMQRLRAVDVEPKIHMLDVPTRTDYWVYIGPFMTHREALGKFKALQHAGVDSYLITTGPLANAVSLGLFSKPGAAGQLRAKRLAQGYPAQVTAQVHTQKQRWVVFQASAAAGIASEFWDRLEQDFAAVGRRESYCGAIVSAQKVE